MSEEDEGETCMVETEWLDEWRNFRLLEWKNETRKRGRRGRRDDDTHELSEMNVGLSKSCTIDLCLQGRLSSSSPFLFPERRKWPGCTMEKNEQQRQRVQRERQKEKHITKRKEGETSIFSFIHIPYAIHFISLFHPLLCVRDEAWEKAFHVFPFQSSYDYNSFFSFRRLNIYNSHVIQLAHTTDCM